jgi:hypothetical protein
MKLQSELNYTAIALLLLNSFGALYGGLFLMTAPDGSSLGLTLELLQQTPFDNYFVPGLVLFCFNGIFSLLVLIALLFNWRKGSLLLIAQGFVLIGWIAIQVYLIKTLFFLHFAFMAIGCILMIIGIKKLLIERAGN